MKMTNYNIKKFSEKYTLIFMFFASTLVIVFGSFYSLSQIKLMAAQTETPVSKCGGVLWGIDGRSRKVGGFYNFTDIWSYGISTCEAGRDNHGEIGAVRVLVTGECWQSPDCDINKMCILSGLEMGFIVVQSTFIFLNLVSYGLYVYFGKFNYLFICVVTTGLAKVIPITGLIHILTKEHDNHPPCHNMKEVSHILLLVLISAGFIHILTYYFEEKRKNSQKSQSYDELYK